ncbi:aquaporin [Amycolatopsis carbonis]|uniref:Aquaporin n=1 Tax=Amycolatopsis carbonis TaxID=715471 RepID=A0A9Y2IAL4_9PSEU|nr:aquaporin [Amycolatopsis sp. 2-15]WIX75456.1 aquaporin [Amycolatopsis sp. 2-15]
MTVGARRERPEANEAAAVSLRDAVREFALTAIVLCATVVAVGVVFGSGWKVAETQVRVGQLVIAGFVAVLLVVLIRSPWGRRSGGHMNPVVTLGLWLMGAFPGRHVTPYVCAQSLGSLAGTAVAAVVLGPLAGQVHFGTVSAAPAWSAGAVFACEAAGGVATTLLAGYFLAHPRYAPLLPYAIAVAVAALIVGLGPLSGGAVNPARQLGPAVLDGSAHFLWIYLPAPAAGAILGAVIHRLLIRRVPATHRLCGTDPH